MSSPLSGALDRTVLADVVLPRAASRFGIPAVLGTILIALSAQVAIPIPGSPVPVTGQTFAVLLTAAALGPGRGLASQALYLALGAVGLPVFTGGAHGTNVIAGPTGGYLAGFLLAAAIVGTGSRWGTDRSPVRSLAVMAVASVGIYLTGAGWLALSTGIGVGAAVNVGVVPFLSGDCLKAILAAGMLPTAWRLISFIDHDGGYR